MIQWKHLPVDQVVITSVFGLRTLNGIKEHHNGLDLAPKIKNVEGDALYAVCDGKVVISKAQGGVTTQGYGNYIIIQHDGFCTLFGHMKALGLTENTQVKAGQVVGFMGKTGNATGVHTHFEIRTGQYDESFWKKGEYNRYLNSTNPQPFIESFIKSEKEKGDVVLPKTKTWLQLEGEAAIKRLDLLTYGNGLDLVSSPEKWIQLINDPTLAKEQFKDTSDLIAFIFIMLDRISQKYIIGHPSNVIE